MEDSLLSFLRNAELNSYEIAVYVSLLKKGENSAKSIAKLSKVPQGRIYTVLDSLLEKKMIEIMPVRPKIYRAISYKYAFENLLTQIKQKQQESLNSMYSQVKNLEKYLDSQSTVLPNDSGQNFWSVAYNTPAIFSLYAQYVQNSKKELLLTGFINSKTYDLFLKRNTVLDILKNPLAENVPIYMLWNYEFDSRPLTTAQTLQNEKMFGKLQDQIKQYFLRQGFASSIPLQMRYIPRGIQTYFDIIDGRRVFIKLQNPLSARVFATMNILDPQFAEELRRRYMELWNTANLN